MLILLYLVLSVFVGFMLGDLHGYRSGSASGYAAGIEVGKLEGACEELERSGARMDSLNVLIDAEIAASVAARGGGR